MTKNQIAAAVLVMVLWGFNFLAVKETVEYLPPYATVAIRFFIVSLLVVPFVPYPKGRTKALIISALLLGVGHFGVLFYGVSMVDTGLSSILNRSGGIALAVLGVILLGERISKRLWAGILLSMVGVVVLVVDTSQIAVSFSWRTVLGSASIVFSSILWGYATIYMKRTLSDVSTFCQVGWVAFYSVPGCALVSWLTEVHVLQLIAAAPTSAWLGLIYTVVGSSIVAYGIWYELIKRCEVSKLSVYLFLMPVIGMLVGVVFRGDPLTPWRITGSVMILLAMRLSMER
jgi:O-acetylserine/cysteine efflux transporter